MPLRPIATLHWLICTSRCCGQITTRRVAPQRLLRRTRRTPLSRTGATVTNLVVSALEGSIDTLASRVEEVLSAARLSAVFADEGISRTLFVVSVHVGCFVRTGHQYICTGGGISTDVSAEVSNDVMVDGSVLCCGGSEIDSIELAIVVGFGEGTLEGVCCNEEAEEDWRKCFEHDGCQQSLFVVGMVSSR